MAGPKAKASYVSWTPDEEQQLAVRMVDLQASDPDASMGWMLMAAQDVLPVTRRRPYATWYKVSDVLMPLMAAERKRRAPKPRGHTFTDEDRKKALVKAAAVRAAKQAQQAEEVRQLTDPSVPKPGDAPGMGGPTVSPGRIKKTQALDSVAEVKAHVEGMKERIARGDYLPPKGPPLSVVDPAVSHAVVDPAVSHASLTPAPVVIGDNVVRQLITDGVDAFAEVFAKKLAFTMSDLLLNCTRNMIEPIITQVVDKQVDRLRKELDLIKVEQAARLEQMVSDATKSLHQTVIVHRGIASRALQSLACCVSSVRRLSGSLQRQWTSCSFMMR
jgi:hypothetical protein